MANLNLSEIQEQLKITTEHINQLKSLIITLQTKITIT